MNNAKQRNPHFDDGRIHWSDEYSGLYDPPPAYETEFDTQWHMALEGQRGFANTAADIDELHIDDLIFETTGKHPKGSGYSDFEPGSRVLDKPLDPALILGKNCADAGCGLGRWTRLMQRLGAASVTSFDASPSAVASVKRVNPNAYQTNIMRLAELHPEWIGQFDFVICWGVVHHTHDPALAFRNVAALVKPETGVLYLAAYAIGGIHDLAITNTTRRIYHSLPNAAEKARFNRNVAERRWDWRLPLIENLHYVQRNLRRLPKSRAIGVQDMHDPFYNWVIPFDVLKGWFDKAGFRELAHLNENQNPRPLNHVLGLHKRA